MLLSTAQLRGNRQQLRLMLLISPPRLQCYLLFFMPLFPLLLLLCCCAVAGNSFASAVVAARARQKKRGTCQMACFLGSSLCNRCTAAARHAASADFAAAVNEPLSCGVQVFMHAKNAAFSIECCCFCSPNCCCNSCGQSCKQWSPAQSRAMLTLQLLGAFSAGKCRWTACSKMDGKL